MKLVPYKYIRFSQCLPVIIQKQLNFIYETGSLTNKLRQKYLDVSLIRNHFQVDELYFRDVIILVEQKTQWCARTIIPENTLNRFKILFPINQKNAIGDFLFSHPNMKRLSLELGVSSSVPSVMFKHFGLYTNSRNLYWLRTSKWCFENKYFFEILEIF